MAVAAYLVRHPELEHGVVKLGLTPDEEVGRGAELFDIEGFGADFAFTADGSGVGELTFENFNAAAVTVTFTGVTAHTGTAKGALVNSVKLAAEFVARLPQGRLSPETTDEYEGFVHPDRIAGDTAETTVTLIARDFTDEGLDELCRLLRDLAAEVSPDARVEVHKSYSNMRPFLDSRPEILAAAEKAIRSVGLEPIMAPLRGGTDGAVLTERGLPTPNLGTGSGSHHSKREWACGHCMAAAAAILVELAKGIAR
jgi:tripeptide aminopeptidase